MIEKQFYWKSQRNKILLQVLTKKKISFSPRFWIIPKFVWRISFFFRSSSRFFICRHKCGYVVGNNNDYNEYISHSLTGIFQQYQIEFVVAAWGQLSSSHFWEWGTWVFCHLHQNFNIMRANCTTSLIKDLPTAIVIYFYLFNLLHQLSLLCQELYSQYWKRGKRHFGSRERGGGGGGEGGKERKTVSFRFHTGSRPASFNVGRIW